MKTVQQIMQETGAEANIRNFRYMQENYTYKQKIRHAENVARSYQDKCSEMSLNCHISVGGLDSITLHYFLETCGVHVPCVSCSSLEQKGVQAVHKQIAAEMENTYSAREWLGAHMALPQDEIDTITDPDTRAQEQALHDACPPVPRMYFLKPLKPKTKVIEELGWPVLSKEIAGKISLLQNPTPKNATVRHAIITGETGEYGGFQKNSRMKLSQRWLEKFGGADAEGAALGDVKPFLLYRVEKEPTMERRKDKNNHVLKDGESYREKEHRYMYRWVDSDKKRHCTYAQTLRELRKKEAEINRNKSDGISSAGSNLRLDDVYNLWKKNKVGLKQSTYVNYLYMYEHFIGPKIGKMKIKDIRKSTVLGLYNDLTRSNDIGKTMAINTLEVIHNVLRQVLQVAVDDDYIRKNPTEGVLREVKKANNYERPKRKALTLEQQNAFIRFLKSKPLYYSWSILFAVLLGTGCRIAEFIGLRWCDIDWKNNTISINHNLVYRQHTDGKCYFSVTTPKTSAGCRTIPMMKDVRRALEDEKIRQQELGVRCTTVIDGYTDFAFFNRFGQPHNPAAINREIDRLVLAYNAQEMEKAAEENRTPVILPDFSCHQLRHTFCTRYCEIEPNIKVIQEVMGHKDIKTTMEIYAEAQKELKERSVQNISGKFDVY